MMVFLNPMVANNLQDILNECEKTEIVKKLMLMQVMQEMPLLETSQRPRHDFTIPVRNRTKLHLL